MITIFPLKKIESETVNSINLLLPQLSSRARKVSRTHLSRVVDPKNGTIFLVRDGKKIIGMGAVIWVHIPLEFYARIEDVVVDSAYRGRGLGTTLVKKLIAHAKTKGARFIDFTSRPDRPATVFYKKLGFEKRETNVYRLLL